MAKVIDPDDLVVSSSLGNLGTDGNIWLDTAASTFTLAPYGALTSAKEGVTIQSVYSKFIDLYTTSAYNKFEFPMYTIDAKSGQYIFGFDGGTYSGWKPADDTTRQMLRDGGWSEYSSAGVLNRQYVGIVSLGDVNVGAQLYYQKTSGGAATDFTFDDEVNEGIQVFGDASNGNFDNRTFFKGYVREEAKKYKDSVLADTGQTATGAYTVNLLLSNEDDLDITDTDANVASILPYTKINVKYFSSAYSRDVDSATNRNFGIVIDAGTWSGVDGSAPGGASVLTTAAGGMTTNEYAGGTLTLFEGTNENVSFPIVSNTATTITVTGTIAVGSGMSFRAAPATPLGASLQEIYTKVQYLLRQATDINSVAGAVTGKTASLLLNFVGPTLNAGFFAPTNPNGGGSGVIVEGLKDADINSINFYDNTAATRIYPYASAGTLNFNSVLTAGGTGYYRMYFTDLPGSLDYGLTGAVTVNDKDGNPIQGTITGSSISFTFDYTNNTQGGRTGGTPASVTVVAGNAGSAKPVVATGTITESKSVSITATAEQDRAYLV
jgi:hypothetical protein